jgi:hypothetical protein
MIKPKVTVIKAIRVKIYGESKVYTTAKKAATEYAYWSNSAWEQKKGIRTSTVSARQLRLERRVSKLFEEMLK